MEDKELTAKEMAEKVNNVLVAIEQKGEATAKELADLQKAVAKLSNYDVLVKEHAEMSARLKALEENGNKTSYENIEKELKSFFNKNKENLKSIFKDGKGSIELEVGKTVGNITTSSGSYGATPPTLAGTQQAPLENINLRTNLILSAANGFTTTLAAFPYTESKPKDGDALFTAEGTPKPQIDFDWETNYAKPLKAAAWERLTEESIDDVDGLMEVARNFLFNKHNLRKQRGVLFGSGNGTEPLGATLIGRQFNPGAMLHKVKSPNFMNIVNAAITDIYTTHNFQDEMPYMANLVLVNPIDFYIYLVSATTKDGVPLYPQASLFNQVTIGGVTILPEEMIPAGKIFVCDMKKYNVSNYKPYTVRIGWINDDLIKNQFVMVGESRFHAFVKELDKQAFIYDDIETIKNLIDEAKAS